METLASAVIGGIFSLLGVWLGHYLQSRSRTQSQENAKSPTLSPQPASVPDQRARPSLASQRTLARGLWLLLGDFILIVFVVSEWDLNKAEPWWENYFAFFALGAIPVYALYLIVVGFYRRLRGLL